MSDFPLASELVNTIEPVSWGGDALVYGSTITAGASDSTKGSWTEIETSTPWGLKGVEVFVHPLFDAAYLIDVGIGASGSEQIIVPNYLIGGQDRHAEFVFFPFSIPSGTRIAARSQSSGANDCVVGVRLWTGGFGFGSSSTVVDAYGVDTSNTKGVSVSTNASGTKGSWTEITSSTSRNYRAVIVQITVQTPSLDQQSSAFDLGIGPAGSEQIIVPDLMIGHDNSCGNPTGIPRYFPLQVPSGSRLAMRGTTEDAGQTFETSLYGVA